MVSRHTRRDVRRRMDNSGANYGHRTVPARHGSVKKYSNNFNVSGMREALPESQTDNHNYQIQTLRAG
jgi:hypothetical protein